MKRYVHLLATCLVLSILVGMIAVTSGVHLVGGSSLAQLCFILATMLNGAIIGIAWDRRNQP